MKRKIKGVFFDLYGTLLVLGDEKQSWKDWARAFYNLVKHKTDLFFEEFSEKCDGLFSGEKSKAPGFTTYETFLDRHLKGLSIVLTREELRTVADETPRTWQKNISALPGTLETLASLKKSYRLALISNFDHAPHVMRTLEDFKLAGFFDPIIVSDDAGVAKPDKRIFEMALRKAGLRAEETVFVGDNPADDIDGALAAGMVPVQMVRAEGGPITDYNHVAKVEKAVSRPGVRTIRSLSELLEIL